MPNFITLENPLSRITQEQCWRTSHGTPREFIRDMSIDMTGKIVIVDGKAVEDWDVTLSPDSQVVITRKIGAASLTILIVALAISVALFFFLPTVPNPAAQDVESDSAYTLRGKRNQSRLSQPIEKHFGKVRIYPPYMSKPFTEYKGQDQWLYSLFCLGLGRYEIHDIKIGDTPVSDFSDVEYEIVQPNRKVKLFPTNVQTSEEVGGIEMLGSNESGYDWIGPFPICNASERAYKLQVDIAAREGIYYVGSNGDGTFQMGIEVEFELRQIDDNGAPVSGAAWERIIYHNEWHHSERPDRFTLEADLTEGRYEIRGRRLGARYFDNYARHSFHWEALRSFCDSPQEFGGVTLLAVSARASDNLNDSNAKAFNVEMTSILPVWNEVTEEWEREETRNPVWAFCDILKARYGKQIGNRFIDIANLSQIAADLETENITFDGSFADAGTVWDSLATVAAICKGVPVVIGGQVSMVRDVPLITPTLGFNSENIVRGSVSTQLSLSNHADHDGIEVEYLNGNTFERETVKCLLENDRGQRCRQIRLHGCIDRNRAYRWGLYQRAVEVYQRENITFETGLEGGTAIFGDLVAISHETIPTETPLAPTSAGRLPSNAFSEVGGVTRIGLEKPVIFEVGKSYSIALRTSSGEIQGPFLCDGVEGNPFAVDLQTLVTPDDYEVITGGERGLYWFGEDGDGFTRAKIVRIEPGSDESRVKITATPYTEDVYSFESLDAPPKTSEFALPQADPRPIIENLTVETAASQAGYATATWRPARGARYYIVKLSYDGIKFLKIGNPTVSNFTFQVLPPAGSPASYIYIKVAAVNEGAGPFASWDGVAGNLPLPADMSGLNVIDAGGGNATASWNLSNWAESYLVMTSPTGTTWTTIATLPHPASTHTFPALANPFYVRVVPQNGTGNGAPETWSGSI